MSLVREAVADELKRPVYDEGCRQFLRIASATWAGDPVKPDLVLLVSVCESELPGYAFRVVPAGSGYALSPFDSPRQSSDAEAFDKDSWTPGHNGWEEARAVDMDGDGRLEIVLAYVSGTHGYLTLDMMRKDRADGVWRRVWQEGILREGHWTMVPGKDAQPSIVLFSSDSGMLEHDPPRPYHYSEFVWDDTRGTMRWVRGADSDRPWNEDKWTRQAGIVLEGMQTSP